MTSNKDTLPFQALELAGFKSAAPVPSLFVTETNTDVCPAYYCVPIRRKGEVSFDGGLGLYFPEFENFWIANSTKSQRNQGFTLPLIMLIDNFPALIQSRALRYTSDFTELVGAATCIYNLCRRMPNCLRLLDEAFLHGTILEKRVSDYLHIFDYHADENAYFQKAVNFIDWYAARWPHLAENLYKCLTPGQSARVIGILGTR